MHIGEIVIKRVRTFEEIAGDPVILVHRMTKNALPLREYVLMKNSFAPEFGRATGGVMNVVTEREGHASAVLLRARVLSHDGSCLLRNTSWGR